MDKHKYENKCYSQGYQVEKFLVDRNEFCQLVGGKTRKFHGNVYSKKQCCNRSELHDKSPCNAPENCVYKQHQYKHINVVHGLFLYIIAKSNHKYPLLHFPTSSPHYFITSIIFAPCLPSCSTVLFLGLYGAGGLANRSELICYP